jgi:flavin-dependent dehydrogenase
MREMYDVVVIGGGPAGSTVSRLLARQGFSVCLLEKDKHPRMHVGESFLPRNMKLIQDLGLEESLRRVPHVPKFGAEFGIGNNSITRSFSFRDGLIPGLTVFNIERAPFDKMLLDEARKSGVEVFEETPVKEIVNLAREDVRLATTRGQVKGRVLIDASGQGAFLGRALELRKTFQEPELQKVAYFEHFEGVERLPGEGDGHPAILMCDEGWFWIIGLNKTKTSVGFVSHPWFVKTVKVPPKRMLAWAIARCPVVRHRMRHATGPADNVVISDFSYRCKPYAGADGGYFMVGDAAAFLDPIFSAGVTLAMMSAEQASRNISALLRGEVTPAQAERTHIRFVTNSTRPFWRLNRAYYKHSFRELFMHGQGPFQVQRAIISILAAQVFPRPVWSLRWRHHLFDLCVFLQKYLPLVPRREPCRLLKEVPGPTPWLHPTVEVPDVRSPAPSIA